MMSTIRIIIIIIGLLIVIGCVIFAICWHAKGRSNSGLVRKACWIGIVAGVLLSLLPLILYPSIELPTPSGPLKFVAQAKSGAEEVEKIKKHVESQRGIIDSVANQATTAKELANDALLKIKEADEKLINLDTQLIQSKNELNNLQARTELMQLADKAIAYGDRVALESLENQWQNTSSVTPLRTAIAGEILRVKTFYGSSTRIRAVSIQDDGPLGLPRVDDNIKTFMLINFLKSPNWQSRAKAAEILGTRNEKGVAEALVESIQEDQVLDVVKSAVDSFEKITGFEGGDVFGGKDLLNWWNENKETVNNRRGNS